MRYYLTMQSNSSSGIYYQSQRQSKGSGLLDSIISTVTSQAVKEVAQDAAKTLAKKSIVEGKTQGTKKIIIIKKVSGKSLSTKSKNILKKRINGGGNNIVPIEEFVKNI